MSHQKVMLLTVLMKRTTTERIVTKTMNQRKKSQNLQMAAPLPTLLSIGCHIAGSYKNKPNIPQFDDVNTPGCWSEYTFHTKCLKNCAFKGYSMPVGAKPVPTRKEDEKLAGKIGNRSFYRGWKLGIRNVAP